MSLCRRILFILIGIMVWAAPASLHAQEQGAAADASQGALTLRPLSPHPSAPTFQPVVVGAVGPASTDLNWLEALTVGVWLGLLAEGLSHGLRLAFHRASVRHRWAEMLADDPGRRGSQSFVRAGLWLLTLATVISLSAGPWVLPSFETAWAMTGAVMAAVLLLRPPVLWHIFMSVVGPLSYMLIVAYVVILGIAAVAYPFLRLAAGLAAAAPVADQMALAAIRWAISGWALPLSVVGLYLCVMISIVDRRHRVRIASPADVR